MIIEKLLLREGMIENLDTFSEKRNLIYSKTNTKGKSTFVLLCFLGTWSEYLLYEDIAYCQS